MIIANRGGHTKASPGASDILDELTEDRKVYARVQQLLAEVGNTMIDCTPPESYPFPQELNYGINKCNGSSAELFYSIHFNSTKGAYGSEVLIYPGTQLTLNIGNRILANLANLGFTNRGVKARTDLGELTSINCPSMIVEVCFVHEKDAAIYRSAGVEAISRAIANGIDSRVSLFEGGKEAMIKGVVIYKNDAEVSMAVQLARKLGYVIIWSGTPMDYSVLPPENIWGIGGDRGSYTAYLRDDHFISGSDRYETSVKFAEVLESL
ncbi:MAG: N-acetylmuramoyl-L-alanine amidase [Clostridium sp.]|nr:N-acetylmuramoyl-L-alanine amidase [Clostridium sp.]